MFAEFRTVGVALHVEFANGVNTEQHAAGTSGLHVVFGGSGEFDAVEQKDILLRAISGDGKIVGGGGVGDAGAARFLRGKIDDSGIQGKEEIIAAAVEREIIDLLFANDAGNVSSGGIYNGSVGDNGDFGFDGAYLELKVYTGFLVNGEINSGAENILEAGFSNTQFVLTDGESEDEIAADFVGGSCSERAGFHIPGGYAGGGSRSAGGIGDHAGNTGGDLSAGGRDAAESCQKNRHDDVKENSRDARRKHGPPLGRCGSFGRSCGIPAVG